MRLIGAGLPRTATMTQKVALETLGLAPCHHMVEVFANLPASVQWREAFEGRRSAADLLAGYEAMVDWPGSYHYVELMERFPDAKVLLSVRSPEAWAASMRQTIWPCFYGDSLLRHMNAAHCHVDELWGDWMDTLEHMWTKTGLLNGEATTDEWMADAFRRHSAEVQATVPADRLLVWKPADGWEPLCELLELPVPDAPLPRINDTAGFNDMLIDAALAAVQRSREAVPA
jgi:hypothetical protein